MRLLSDNALVALEGPEVDALLDCLASPVLLLRADASVVCVNAAARELETWLATGEFGASLATHLSPTAQAMEHAPAAHTSVFTVRRSTSELRTYQAVMRRVPAAAHDAQTMLLLSRLADHEDPSQPQASTAQARLEDVQRQLLQADRMSSIGQLAAGVAHEINNPIGYIRSNLGTLADYTASLMRLLHAQEAALRNRTGESEIQRQIEEIRQQIDFEFLATDLPVLLAESQEGIARVCKIVQDLRDFSRAGHDEGWTFADLHSGLDSTINIVWNELKYKVELVKNYGSIPLIECLPSQLNQVFMNILVNAGQSIAEHGQISVSTRADDEWVHVEISDTGAGIAQENLGRIFDPFFTTKPVGKGTGFGLSISYGIVQKHGGRIEVRSEVGCGTLFLIMLPIHRTHAATAPAP